MARGDVKQQLAYRFFELTPKQFEGLVFRLAWADDRGVVRLEAPDGGLDTLLPDPERPGKAKQGWQAKRHTKRIDWDDCERSLDQAVLTWEVQGVTFVFPKDLHRTEHATFQRRLAARYADVVVDYWGAAGLAARLDSAEGRRIVAFFFEEQDAVAIAERMLHSRLPIANR